MPLRVKMKNITEKIDELLSGNIISSINKGFSSILPLTILGSLFMLIGHFPFDNVNKFIENYNLTIWIDLPYILTFNTISIYLVFSISFHYGRSLKMGTLSSGFIGVLSFLIVTPLFHNDNYQTVSLEWFGANGMFVAILIGILSIRIANMFIKGGWTIKLPKSVPTEVSQSFFSLIPIICTSLIMLIISFLFDITPYSNIHNCIYSIFQIPLQSLGNSIFAIIIFCFVSNFLWWFGIHGSLLIKSITTPIFLPLAIQNLDAFQAGKELPYVFTSVFNSVYNFGGAGMTLALAFLMMFFSKSKKYSTLGKLSLPSNIFNINEPIVFSTPIILNPIMIIPFVVSPLICTIIPYYLTILGIIPKLISIQIPSTTPIIISGFIQGGWKIAFMQIILFILTISIYFPFFKYIDNKAVQEENKIECEEK